MRAIGLKATDLYAEILKAEKSVEHMVRVNWSDVLPHWPTDKAHVLKKMKAVGIEQEQAKYDVLTRRAKRLDRTYKVLLDQILRFYEALGTSSLKADIGSMALRNLIGTKIKMMHSLHCALCRRSQFV